MRIFFDTEFDDNGKDIELISIGMVRDDNHTYYAVAKDADWDRIYYNRWLVANVIPHLPDKDSGLWKTKDVIADEIIHFVGLNPEFWVGTGCWDWVILLHLVWGEMMSMDPVYGWPWVPNDVTTYKRYLEVNHHLGTASERPHDALSDAIEIKKKWEILRRIDMQKKSR